jgi:hypothetical protein
MERSTIFHGKIHYFDWVIFNSYVTNYQRVFIFIYLDIIYIYNVHYIKPMGDNLGILGGALAKK